MAEVYLAKFDGHEVIIGEERIPILDLRTAGFDYARRDDLDDGELLLRAKERKAVIVARGSRGYSGRAYYFVPRTVEGEEAVRRIEETSSQDPSS